MAEDTQYTGTLVLKEEASTGEGEGDKGASGASKGSKNAKAQTYPFVSSEVIGWSGSRCGGRGVGESDAAQAHQIKRSASLK